MKTTNASHVRKLLASYEHCITMAADCQEGSQEQTDWYNLSDGIGDIIATYEGGLAQLKRNITHRQSQSAYGLYPNQ
jgi:hypothetical protein